MTPLAPPSSRHITLRMYGHEGYGPCKRACHSKRACRRLTVQSSSSTSVSSLVAESMHSSRSDGHVKRLQLCLLAFRGNGYRSFQSRLVKNISFLARDLRHSLFLRRKYQKRLRLFQNRSYFRDIDWYIWSRELRLLDRFPNLHICVTGVICDT
ncbi:hypothetical protein ARMGADRAFT_729259 [Armillaria gallica]|uniref:Uncharacterized protein n=1 Tax=Armillaria gallica TaxID=47427 RepID=A0A2H3CHX6_ARMGA|nr:hypothetical protein ARMGADRAFT_729259 [Armillaria gallica]